MTRHVLPTQPPSPLALPESRPNVFVQRFFCDFTLRVSHQQPQMLITRPHRTARNDEACWWGTTVFYLSCWAVFLRAYPTQSCVSPLASLWTSPFLQDSKDSFRGFYGVRMPHQGRAPFLTGSEEWEPSKPPPIWWGEELWLAVEPEKCWWPEWL